MQRSIQSGEGRLQRGTLSLTLAASTLSTRCESSVWILHTHTHTVAHAPFGPLYCMHTPLSKKAAFRVDSAARACTGVLCDSTVSSLRTAHGVCSEQKCCSPQKLGATSAADKLCERACSKRADENFFQAFLFSTFYLFERL